MRVSSDEATVALNILADYGLKCRSLGRTAVAAVGMVMLSHAQPIASLSYGSWKVQP